MKPRSKYELSEMLSAYVDGELSQEEAKELEAFVASNPEAAAELHELQKMKNLLASKKRIPDALGFWTRLSAEIEHKEKEQDSLLPFPRRYLPLVYATGAVAVVLVGLLLFQQRSTVLDYVGRQSEVVQKAVQDNVLRGGLFPLFTNVDKNQALQFALFGVLPLDAKEGTALRVDESAERGYRIDVGKKAAQAIPSVTVGEFIEEVRPTARQQELIDSVLDIGSRHIESAVLMADDRALAIDENLHELNRVMLSGIAASLQPSQRLRFEKFLESKRAPYRITATHAAPELPEKIFRDVWHVRPSKRRIVVTADTLVYSELQLNLDSLRKQFESVARARSQALVRFDGFIRRFAEGEAPTGRQVMIAKQPLVVVGDTDELSIHVGHDFMEMPVVVRRDWVERRPPRTVAVPRVSRERSFNFNVRVSEPESSFQFHLDMDSLFLRMQKEGPEAAIEFFMGDPGLRIRVLESKGGRSREQMDSLVQAKRRARARVDSLIRVMQERERLDRR